MTQIIDTFRKKKNGEKINTLKIYVPLNIKSNDKYF